MTNARRAALLAMALAAGACVSAGASPPPLVASAVEGPSAQYRPRLAAPLAAPSAGAQATRLLAAHNRERAAVGVPPLRWDPMLAAAAASYGPALAATGTLTHSPRTSRPGQAENLWMGSAGAYSPENMVGSWASEKAMFRRGIFPNVSTTGNWLDVSHYTQMIWRTTTAVGCAVHRARGMDYLICRYAPKGNQDGRAVP